MPSLLGGEGTTASASEDGERDNDSAASGIIDGDDDDDATQQSAMEEDENSIPPDDDGCDGHEHPSGDERNLSASFEDEEDQDDSHESNVLQNDEEANNDDASAVEEEDDNASRSSQSSSGSTDHASPIMLGGPNGSNGIPAYALLAGMIIDPSTKKNEMISIPITRIPTTLGREHETKDPSFIGLKEDETIGNEADARTSHSGHIMSQSMCCIFYRDAHGGKLGQYKKGRKKENPYSEKVVVDEKGEKSIVVANPLGEMMYKPYEESPGGDDHEKCMPDDILRPPGMDANAPLPTSGFFAIECTGRKIMVGGRTLKKGQSAMLKDGIPIKIGATHCFYFLLPKESKASASNHLPSMKVKVPTPVKPDKVVSSSSSVKLEDIESQSTKKGGKEGKATPTQPQTKQPLTKKQRTSLESSFDGKTDSEVLAILSEKIVGEAPWDRECQSLGSSCALRACRAAARSSEIQKIVRTEGGVTQREILDWMGSSTCDFEDYESMMLARIEKKSFMMSIQKAIIRAGYTKNEYLSGKSFRYNLPEDIPMIKVNDEKVESSSGDNEKKPDAAVSVKEEDQ